MTVKGEGLFILVVTLGGGLWLLVRYRWFARGAINFWGLEEYFGSKQKYYERFCELMFLSGGLLLILLGISLIINIFIR